MRGMQPATEPAVLPSGRPTTETHFDAAGDPKSETGTSCPELAASAPAEFLPPESLSRGPAVWSLSPSVTEEDHRQALETAQVCERFLELQRQGMSLRMAAAELGRSPSWFCGESSPVTRFRRGGLAALLPERRGPRAAGSVTVWIESLGWFVPAARHFYLLTNRTWSSGSVPEAIRRVISLPAVPAGWGRKQVASLMSTLRARTPGGWPLDSLPECPVELREMILERERQGQPMVPERIARQVAASRAQVRMHRNPTDFDLDYLCAPGGMRMVVDPETGERRRARALEVVEADDATINFPVCVPWTLGGTPSSDRYGVMVGRFQWLVFIDAGTSQVLGYSYTARPRSSYRGEDVLSAMRTVCRQHGIPRTWRFEQGVWKSHLVTGAIQQMGCRLDTVYSPHQKPFIEGLFSTLWTKLSVHFPDAHVGRFQGEHEAACDLLTACQAGHKDPRRYFPMLAQVLGAFDEAIAEKNRTPVSSSHHGRWVPAERFAADLATWPARALDPVNDWMFAPFVREWTVRGMLVGGRVPVFETVSVPFDFSAPFLPDLDGARVRAYFDPADPRCHAQLVLAQPWQGRPAGQVLGSAAQVNSTAGYVRLVMGWGDDPQMAGVQARQVAAAGVRREVRATVPTGRGARLSEERNGLGAVSRIESAAAATPAAAPEAESALAETPVQREAQMAARRAETEQMLRDFERENYLLLNT